MHWTLKINWYQITIWWTQDTEFAETWGYYAETGIRIKIPIPLIYIREYWLYDSEPDPDDIPF